MRRAIDSRLIRSSLVVFMGNSTARFLGFLFSVAAARILLTQDYGRFAVGLAVASIAAILVANAPRGLSRFLARHDGDRSRQDTYFNNWLMVVLITLGVSLVLLPPIARVAGLSGWMIVAVGANIVGVAAFETYREAQRGLRSFTPMVVFYVTANVIQLVAILAAAALGWRSAELFVTIYGLSSLAALALMQSVRPVALGFLPGSLSWRRIKSIVLFARPLVLQTVFNAVWAGIDIVLVGRILGPTATGNYAAAKTLVTILALAPLAIGIVTGPEVARLAVEGKHQIRAFVTAAIALTACVSVPIAVGLVWFKEPITLLVFGHAYPFAARPVTALAAGATLYAFSLVLENLWVGLGHPRITAIASGAAMVSTVTLGLVLIPRIADIGAAVAYASGAAAQLAVIGSFTAWTLLSGSTVKARSLSDLGILDS
jgi:O-antigen/teichoic acid export membrane protein